MGMIAVILTQALLVVQMEAQLLQNYYQEQLPKRWYLRKLPAEEDDGIARFDSEINKQILKEFPKGFQLADNLKNHLWQIVEHYAKTRRLKVSMEQMHKRLEICKNCPSNKMVIKNGVMRCGHKSCGCCLNNPNNRPALGGKAEYEALICDEGHWDKIDEQYSK